jgi:hypothetical protein
MLPEDCEAFFEHLRQREGLLKCTLLDSKTEAVDLLESPCAERKTLAIWTSRLLPDFKRKYIEKSVDGPYYRADCYSLPVLEFSPCFVTEWNGLPGLIQGRIWGGFTTKNEGHERWFSSITRWIRANYARNKSFFGWVGPHAQRWQRQGNLLLPSFVPQVTDAWTRVFSEQRAASGKSGTDPN